MVPANISQVKVPSSLHPFCFQRPASDDIEFAFEMSAPFHRCLRLIAASIAYILFDFYLIYLQISFSKLSLLLLYLTF